MSSARQEATVVVAAVLPPPIHGQAVVNAAVVERLRKMPISLTVCNTSPDSLKRDWRYHTTRFGRTLHAATILLMRAVCTQRKTLYMPLEAGSGVVYNMLLAISARLFGFSIILHHHSSAHTLSKNPMFSVLARLCGGGATHVVLSRHMAVDLSHRYGLSTRIIVSPNACHVAQDIPIPRARVEGAPLTVGLLANLTASKGLHAAIDTVSDVRSAGDDVRLVLAGPAVGAEAVETIKRARQKLGDALIVTGAISGKEKEDFFGSIDLFLFPTTYRYEAQPLVIYESLSYGVPVISTKIGYIPDMLEGIGTVVPVGNELRAELVAAVRKFAAEPTALKEASLGARSEFLSAVSMSRDAFGVLCQIISGAENYADKIYQS
jgi:glycosyltransferase involved in cell wall biosynthesis